MFSKTLLFLTFLAVLFAVSYAQDACLLFTTCDDCTNEPTGNCGWCESTDECLTGNVVGPGGSAANCSEWFFDNCLAVDCNRFTSCSSCLRDPFCGWCEATTTCVEGVRTGPVTGTCSDYIFDRSGCPSTSTTASTTGRRTTTTGRRTTTTGRRTTTTGSRGTTGTTGSRTTGTTGSRTTGGTTGSRTTGGTTGSQTTGGTTGSRTTGSRTTGGTTGSRTTGSVTTGGSGTTGTATSTTSSSTTGQVSSSAAYSINSASFVVAIGVVVIALVNLLW